MAKARGKLPHREKFHKPFMRVMVKDFHHYLYEVVVKQYVAAARKRAPL